MDPCGADCQSAANPAGGRAPPAAEVEVSSPGSAVRTLKALESSGGFGSIPRPSPKATNTQVVLCPISEAGEKDRDSQEVPRSLPGHQGGGV